MYRDDLAATHARVEQLQRELTEASSQAVQDQQRIAMLNEQLMQMQQALQRMGAQMPYPAYPAYAYAARASTILTLGILSLVLCSIMGPIAWSMGTEELRRIDMGQTSPLGRGSVVAGRVCGIVGTVMLIFGAVIGIVAVAAAVSAGHHHHYNSY